MSNAQPPHSRPERPSLASTTTAIAEPMTVVTDMILGIQTLLYAFLLRRGSNRSQKSVKAWSLTMAAVSAAAFAGALTHAVYHDSPLQWALVMRNVAWKAVGISTALASGLMLAASIYSTTPANRRLPYFIAVGAKTVTFAAMAWISGNFLFTIIDYAISMLIVLYIQVRHWRTSTSAPWLTAGILVSFVAAGLQRSGIILHAHLNYNDIYHLVQVAAFHLLYEGARRESDYRETGEVASDNLR